MGIFAKYPYTDFNNLNLDWILQRMREVEAELQRYLDNAVITFADPITWDITEQYTALTVVVDSDGTAYLSKQPVPTGVSIDNTNYWLPIFNYDDNINELRAQIAYNERTSATAIHDINEGDLLFWNGKLYKAITNIVMGTALIEDTNIVKYTVDEKINDMNPAQALADIRSSICYNAENSPTTAINLNEGDLVFWNDTLYHVTDDMTAGTAFVVGTNIEVYTVDEKINDLQAENAALQQALSDETGYRIAADNALQNAIDNIEIDEYIPYVLKFGAIGDGVTDDTDALQTAIDSGETVIFEPNKVYKITRQLTIKNDNVIIDGNGSTMLCDVYTGSSTRNWIYVNLKNNITIKNLTIDGNAATGSTHLISMFGTKNITIDNCEFTRGYGYALRLNDGCANVRITRCNFHDIDGPAGNPGGAIYGISYNDLIINDCYAEHLGDHFAYITGSSRNVMISNCIVKYAGENELTAGAAYVAYGNTSYMTVKNCIAQNCRTGFHVAPQDSYDSAPTYIDFIDCTAASCISGAFDVVGTNAKKPAGINFIGCTSYSSGSMPAFMVRYANRVRIDRCTAVSSNVSSLTARGVRNLLVVNNYFAISNNSTDYLVMLGDASSEDADLVKFSTVFNNILSDNRNAYQQIYFRNVDSNTFAFNNTNIGSSTAQPTVGGTGARFYNEKMPDRRSIYYMSAAPTSPTLYGFRIGDIIFNTNPAASGNTPFAWICTADGNQGTWRAININ